MDGGTLWEGSFHVPQDVQLVVKEYEIVRWSHGTEMTHLTTRRWINQTVFERNVWEERSKKVATTSRVRRPTRDGQGVSIVL